MSEIETNDSGRLGAPARRARAQAALAAAQQLRQRGETEAALNPLRDAARGDPTNIQVRIATGDLLREIGRFDEAEALYRAALDLAPTTWRAATGIAHCRQRLGDCDTALAWFREAARLEPANPNIRVSIGRLLLRETGRTEAAAAEFRAALETAPGQIQALLGLAECRSRGGERIAALAAYRGVTAADPNHVPARLAIGNLLHQLGRFDEAETEFREVLARGAGQVDALLGLGRCAVERLDQAAAIELFRAAAAMRPDDARGPLAIADILRDRGEFDHAADAVKAVLAGDESSLGALLSLGRIYRLAGKREAARAIFQRAAERHPANVLPLIEVSTEERALGQIGEARRLLQAALAIEPDNAAACLASGQLAESISDFEAALRFFTRATATPSGSLAGYLGAATTLLNLGRLGDALDLLDRAEGRLGECPQICGKRVSLLMAVGDWPAALTIVRHGSGLFPYDFALWKLHVELESRGGDPRDADRLLEKAPTTNNRQQSQAYYLRGAVAAEKWQLESAAEHFRSALTCDAGNAAAAMQLAQRSLMEVDLPQARKYLGLNVKLEAPKRLNKGRRAHPSQTPVGQLLNEYALEPAALAELAAASVRPPQQAIEPLREIVDRFPEYTPAAITMFIALRRSGLFDRAHRSPKTTGQIPLRIVQ